MKRAVLLSLVRTLAVSFLLAGGLEIYVGHASDGPSALRADATFIQALAKADKPALDQLLDKYFVWIDSNGQVLTKPQVLESLPTPANSDVQRQERIYGDTAVVRANRDHLQMLRLWVKRESGWRAVLYQEVRQVDKSEPPAAADASSGECENPCKFIPFEPETQSEKEVIASWQGVMRAMANDDAEAYAPLIADEFTATDTHHDRPYSKVDRLAQINKQKLRGARAVPPELITAHMYDFGDTVLMIAREQRAKAKPYLNTRMWAKREGRWQMLFSFNTRIEQHGA